jgi:DNA excision repair protein ERCC-8
MNPLLFERSTGKLGPNEFARIQSTSLLRSFSAAPRFRFDGGEYDTSSTASAASDSGGGDGIERASIWAHQAGVSALALERFDGRM